MRNTPKTKKSRVPAPGSRALTPHGGDDRVYTPPPLARQIVQHFKPEGYSILEPCEGKGAFTDAFAEYGVKLIFSCEIDRGEDFMTWEAPVDWIITNPPWSKFRAFLNHSMKLADDIVFLVTLNHFFTRARLRDVRAAGFGFVEILLFETPAKPWPQSGFQVVAGHIRRGHDGPMTFSHANDKIHP